MLRIGFTGTRHGMTSPQQDRFTEELSRLLREFGQPSEFHHGDCVGADAQAQKIASDLGFEIHRHPPCNPYRQANTAFDIDYIPKHYRERNRDIVRLTDFLFACPKDTIPQTSGGTWYTYNHASQQGSYKRAMLIYPDGIILYPMDRWLTPLNWVPVRSASP